MSEPTQDSGTDAAAQWKPWRPPTLADAAASPDASHSTRPDEASDPMLDSELSTDSSGTDRPISADEAGNPLLRLEQVAARLAARPELVTVAGSIVEVTPTFCRVAGLSSFVRLGECLRVVHHDRPHLAEVVRIDQTGISIKPFEPIVDFGIGTKAIKVGFAQVSPHPSWHGRVLNALGAPIDGGPSLQQGPHALDSEREPPRALRRARVTTPIQTGVRAIDLFTPLCMGQRIGIFAGSGVGKSTLLAMLARARGFDTVVIALVGERGREVREFLEDALDADLGRTVAIVSTADESPMMRRLAPKTALCVAESFRDAGHNVLLMVDSVTRFAQAAREVALAAGEPPVARGFPPSVFSDLPKLLERAGPGEEGAGSITAVFSVLVDGDDHNDPVADSIRGTLDGHIVLDRAIADQGRFPAINLLGSISRLAHHVWTPEQNELVRRLRAMIAQYEDTKDLRLMGGHRPGADPGLDKAIEMVPRIYEAMRQAPGDAASEDAFQELAKGLATPT
jgi:flagellum-specific ATP synthase